MTPEESKTNQGILKGVEALGGGYVWDAEVFAVTLMDVAVEDDAASRLCGLRGVQQIALDASRLSVATITALAGIAGLKVLVLSRPALTEDQRSELSRFGPEIVEVDDSGLLRPQPDVQRQGPTARRTCTMTKEDAQDDLLSPAESERVARLSPKQLAVIDAALLAQVSTDWRKVAQVVGTAMLSMPDRPMGVPDVFFAQRVALLVAAGRIESRGDLRRMGFSEVRHSSS